MILILGTLGRFNFIISILQTISFAEDPAKHMRDSFARKFPDMSTERFASAISKFLDFGRWAKKSPDVFKNILQTPMMYGPNYMTGIEFLNASVRGIKDISLDMRRNKEALKTYVDAQWAQMTRPNMLATKNNPHSDATVVDFGSAMLAHALMNIVGVIPALYGRA